MRGEVFLGRGVTVTVFTSLLVVSHGFQTIYIIFRLPYYIYINPRVHTRCCVFNSPFAFGSGSAVYGWEGRREGGREWG